jgi:predicted nucleic acid-binding protein
MVKALFDTNILVDYLKNIDAARGELDCYEDKAISVVTWIEVMVGAPPAAEVVTREFLDRFTLVGIEPEVAEDAANLRRSQRIKLPDAIIWASARQTGRLLVTRNTKDFPAGDPGVREPYRL